MQCSGLAYAQHDDLAHGQHMARMAQPGCSEHCVLSQEPPPVPLAECRALQQLGRESLASTSVPSVSTLLHKS